MSIQWMPVKGCWTVRENILLPNSNFMRHVQLAEFKVGIPTPQEIGAALILAMEFVETTQALLNPA